MSKWNITLFGMAEFDIMSDSTQSFQDSGFTVIKRSDTSPYEATHGRTQITARNSRLGVRGSAPEFEGMRASGFIDMDFFGAIPAGTSESATFSSGTFRMRSAWAKLESDYVDVLAGQTYYLIQWMPFFYPCTASFFPTPNMGFGRPAQLRVSHAFKTDRFNLEVAVAAVRPPQRDANVPDMQAAINLGMNERKGIHSLGSGPATFDPLTVAISGSARQFRVDALAGSPTPAQLAVNGYAISIDGFIPVIPTHSLEDRGNALSLTGGFITGSGMGDLGGYLAGPPFPPPPNPTRATPSPVYTANIDNNGMVVFAPDGTLHTVNYEGVMAGLQYYFPPSGRLYLGANFTWGKSDNLGQYLLPSAAKLVYTEQRYIDTTLFFDVTPSIKAALLYGNYHQVYADGFIAENQRGEFSAYFYF